MEKERLTIRWVTEDQRCMDAIRKRFNIGSYMTINSWTPCEIDPEDISVFKETAARGFFSIIPVKWCKNGGSFSFISR